MEIRIPFNCLCILVGPSGSGKSHFANKYFPSASIVSSDGCRKLLITGNHKEVCEEQSLQKYSDGAFILFRNWIRGRLRHNLLTVADATNLIDKSRQELEEIAKEEHVPYIYIVFNTKMDECISNDSKRPFPVGETVIKRQYSNFKRSFRFLKNADRSTVLTPEDLQDITIKFTQRNLEIAQKYVDIIGDIHGCREEFLELLEKLGYVKGEDNLYRHPEGRVFVSVGDVIDRGPYAFECLEFMRQHVEAGLAYMVKGNHENKLGRFLSGHPVKINNGLQMTIDQIPEGYDKSVMKKFLYSQTLPYYIFKMPDDSPFVITHAAFKNEFLGKIDKSIEEYCCYGPTEGLNEEGYPIRIPWEKDYYGIPVVYGHICRDDLEPNVFKNTYGIDTGCVFGGKLTSLRLPEKEIVSVPAKKSYYEKHGPKTSVVIPVIQNLLDTQKLRVQFQDKEFDLRIARRSEMERAIYNLTTKTISPDKIVWFAPTMSPGPASNLEGYMEDPITTAKWMFEHSEPGTKLIAELKHMGSRGVWSFTKVDNEWQMECWTKNGFNMFDGNLKEKVREKMIPFINKIEEKLGPTDFICLDSEVMPWNLKGAGLVEESFFLVASSGHLTKSYASEAYSKLIGRMKDCPEIVEQSVGASLDFQERAENFLKFNKVVENYCWEFSDANDVSTAFFALLAYGNKTGAEIFKTNEEMVAFLNSIFTTGDSLGMDSFTIPTTCFIIENTEESLNTLFDYWIKFCNAGDEGFVLKYNNLDQWSNNDFPQQMLKVRGQEYLRIIYGPQYLREDILHKLKSNRSIKNKMRTAWAETLLANTALKKYLEKKPFEDYHSYIVCAAASEFLKIDPRL